MLIKRTGDKDFIATAKNLQVLLADEIKINDFVLPGYGEYEVSGVSAEVIDGVIALKIEDLRMVYTSKCRTFSDQELEEINGVDILFVPVGDQSPEAQKAREVIAQIEPKIVIPMGYTNLDDFAKGKVNLAPADEYKISKNNLPQEEEQQVVVLNVTSNSPAKNH